MCNRHLLSDVDHLRLRQLLDELRPSARREQRKCVDLLSSRVRGADVVAQRSVPRDVVTMNSLVGLRDLEANEKWSCLLAYPEEADLVARKVSVAAPLGTRMLGQRVGDVIECPVARGVRRLRIERVYYQPEAAGDYHL